MARKQFTRKAKAGRAASSLLRKIGTSLHTWAWVAVVAVVGVVWIVMWLR